MFAFQSQLLECLHTDAYLVAKRKESLEFVLAHISILRSKFLVKTCPRAAPINLHAFSAPMILLLQTSSCTACVLDISFDIPMP